MRRSPAGSEARDGSGRQAAGIAVLRLRPCRPALWMNGADHAPRAGSEMPAQLILIKTRRRPVSHTVRHEQPACRAHLRSRADHPLRQRRPALHQLPHGAAVSRRLQRGGAARGDPRLQRGADSAPAVAVRARAILPQPVLLLRLQPGDHPRREQGRPLPGAAVPRNRADGAAVRPRPPGAPAALWRRHAELSRPAAHARADGIAGAPLQLQPREPARVRHRT